MRLGELISLLERMPQDMVVASGFGSPHSYRGFYEQLAFEPEKNVTVASMLAHAKSALGRTFQGYKGGDFVMYENALCHVVQYGCCSFDGDPDPGALLGLALADALKAKR